MRHILKTQQFSREWLEEKFFPGADMMRTLSKKYLRIWSPLRGREMISFFYEPSTRTRLSFELAMRRLGGEIIFSTENAKEFSSAAKGEVIEDTIRVLCGYKPDVIILRTDEAGMVQRAANFSTVPIINAGDGKDQHPTQALIDLYTIQRELGGIDNTVIAVCGDLYNGRAVRSLVYLYSRFSGVKIFFVSPIAARIGEDIKNYLTEHQVPFEELFDLNEIAGNVDIVYNTRTQKERGTILMRYGPRASWTVSLDTLKLMKKRAIVMHPLPRQEEINPEVDEDPRAAYFRQAENGLYVRMALLYLLFS